MSGISIIAATFYGNRGAEAMLSTTIAELRARGLEDFTIHVYSYYPAEDRSLVSDPDIRIHSSTPLYLVSVLLPGAMLHRLLAAVGLRALQCHLPRSVRSLAGSQVHLCLAGVSFVDGRAKFLPFNIATLWPSMILGVPVVKLSQAMGPFHTLPVCLSAQLFLQRCRLIFTRGEQTHRHLDELFGPRATIQRADDVAFLFRPSYCFSRPAPDLEAPLAALERCRGQGLQIVGLCPSAVIARRAATAGDDYIGWIRALISGLAARDLAVALYPNATRGNHPTKQHNNDLPLLAEILQDLDPTVRSRVIGFTGSWNAAQIHSILSACDVHVVSRFHAMVGSLTAAVPVLVVGWSHKYLEVMSRFAQEDMVFDDREKDLDVVLARIEQLIDEREERARTIISALPDVQDSSRRQFEAVARLITQAT